MYASSIWCNGAYLAYCQFKLDLDLRKISVIPNLNYDEKRIMRYIRIFWAKFHFYYQSQNVRVAFEMGIP